MALTINNKGTQLSWIVTCCIYVAQHSLDFCRGMLFSMQSQKINLIYGRQMHSKYEVQSGLEYILVRETRARIIDQ